MITDEWLILDRMDMVMKKDTNVVSGRPKYGWRRDEQGRLVENTTEQLVIDRIIKLHSNFYGYSGIARRLTQEGIPTGRGKTQWNPSVVRKIIEDNLDRMPLAKAIKITGGINR